MPVIDHRIEADGLQPDYSGRVFTSEEVEAGEHRAFVGGVWGTHGNRQLDFLKDRGLLPAHRLLDIGCGCFRAGRSFIDYLEPGHYFGVDANHSLMQTGYDVELSDEQRARLPVENLRANDRFAVDFGTKFDFAIAQSVFTHVSLNHIRLCLFRAAEVMRPGGSLFVTFFERGRDTRIDHIIGARNEKPFFTEKNVFWYYRGDLRWAAGFSPWKVVYIGDWGHPANQKMMQFIRLTDADVQARAAAKAAKSAPPASRSDALKKSIMRSRKWLAQRLDPSR
jgi:2-polyprenyl-3-methyl-5-hydroxy-6-metoxy-1,4-benzoquinol methylase